MQLTKLKYPDTKLISIQKIPNSGAPFFVLGGARIQQSHNKNVEKKLASCKLIAANSGTFKYDPRKSLFKVLFLSTKILEEVVKKWIHF